MKHYDGPIDIVLRLLAAAGLVVDAVVHLQLAGRYDPNGNTISQGDIFRIEAVVALLVGVVVLFAPWKRIAYLVAFLVAASAFGAVMLYRYVNVGSIGPLPNMYEPIWFTKKTVTAYAEGGAAVVALAGFARAMLRARQS
ncbi:MAG TPA: hypothetical protein VHW74_04930 [Mycobacteriales bacterium]|jgi:hypothetical protein|nr:hypothetical protein [Mycobacteriales bacterium]